MKHIQFFLRGRTLPALVVLGLVCSVAPRLCAQQDVCSGGMVDTGGVEETVCISADVNQVNGYMEITNETQEYGLDWCVPDVGGDAQIYDGSTLVTDTGDVLSTNDIPAIGIDNPNSAHIYDLRGWADECYDPSCMDDYGNCSWYYHTGYEDVGESPNFSPPSNATTYSNLECWGLSGYPGNGYTKSSWNNWTPYQGTQTGSSGTGAGNIYSGQSISGSGACGSLEIADTLDSGTEWNVLAAENVCGNLTQTTSCPTISNLILDMQFVMPSNTTYQALEFDPDVTTSDGYTYTESVECDFSTGIWKYWDSSAVSWNPFSNIGLNNVPGCSLTSGRHHLQLYVTLIDSGSTHTYQYHEMAIDGQVLFNSPSNAVQACYASGQNTPCQGFTQYIGVEEQVDQSCPSGTCQPQTITAYYDHYSLSVW